MVLESQVLRDNHLGDPWRRPLWVYLPPAYQAEAKRSFPAIYLLQGFTRQLDAWRAHPGLRPSPLELYDGLWSAEGGPPPCLLVFVDCWTSLGGSQFLDSPGTGRYHSFLCDEVVPLVDSQFRTLPEAAFRGLAGKSSGGYGAMVTALLRPDLFSAFASHAGDALFEYCYLPEFPEAVRALRDRYQGSIANFRADLGTRPAFSAPADHVLVNVYGMAACYSAGDNGVPELPFDLETGELRQQVWRRWLHHDPVRMIERMPAAATRLRAAYLDAGRADDFHLDVGAQAVAAALRQLGVPVRFELFDGAHAGIEYRYPLGIRHLAESMAL